MRLRHIFLAEHQQFDLFNVVNRSGRSRAAATRLTMKRPRFIYLGKESI
jgi:hypothetical protein